MVKNKDYNWGPEAKLDEITVSYIGSAPAQVQALRNGEADIIAPQASADTVEQLKALESQGVTLDRGSQLAYEHLDLNYSGPFADKNVREAFLKAVPRNDIVDKTVKRLDPNAKPLDSQLFLPDQAGYADSARNNGSAAYQDTDIEGARKLLNGAAPEIRIMYNKENPNNVDAYSLIRESATRAGFTVVDGGLGKSDWGAALGKGGYDAALFGWSNAGVGVSGVAQVFRSGSGSNYNQLQRPGRGQADGRTGCHDRPQQAGRDPGADRQEDLGVRLRPSAVRERRRRRVQQPHHRREVHAEPDRRLVELLGVGAEVTAGRKEMVPGRGPPGPASGQFQLATHNRDRLWRRILPVGSV